MPLLWEERGIGSLCVMRQPPRPFSDKEQALLKTFADQAVIAIQNARLFKETQEALERQTATAEVLRVISESPTDVQPVMEAVARRAGLLCRAEGSRVWRLVDGTAARGDQLWSGVRGHGKPGGPAVIEDFGCGASRARAPVHSHRRRRRGHRFGVSGHSRDPAALRLSHGIECATAARGGGVGRGSSSLRSGRSPPREVALVQSFVDQAVIAIENVRLFQ